VAKTVAVFLSLLKINVPIHVIPLIFFKLKELKGRPARTLLKLLLNIMKSMLFLTSFVSSIHILQCYGEAVYSRSTRRGLLMVSSAISGFGIAFESPHKRSEVTYYCLPKAIEAVWNSLERRGLIRTLPGQPIITFALCMGIIGMCFGDGSKPRTLKGLSLKSSRTLWGDYLCKEVTAPKGSAYETFAC
jgi:hypothetical protein